LIPISGRVTGCLSAHVCMMLVCCITPLPRDDDWRSAASLTIPEWLITRGHAPRHTACQICTPFARGLQNRSRARPFASRGKSEKAHNTDVPACVVIPLSWCSICERVNIIREGELSCTQETHAVERARYIPHIPHTNGLLCMPQCPLYRNHSGGGSHKKAVALRVDWSRSVCLYNMSPCRGWVRGLFHRSRFFPPDAWPNPSNASISASRVSPLLHTTVVALPHHFVRHASYLLCDDG